MSAAHPIRRLLAKPFARHPWILQRVRWPNPLYPPYLQREINLLRPGELGDVIMCLAVVRAIRERNPQARITFITNHDKLLAGHPMLDRVLSTTSETARSLRDVIPLRYEAFVPLRRHAIDYLAGCVGLRDIIRQIPLPDFTGEVSDPAGCVAPPRPWVAMLRKAGPFTPNKDWPSERWDEFIRRMARHATVIELGTGSAAPPVAERHVDLRGTTSERQFCAWISLADLVVSPVTSAVHIAAAYGVPTLSVLGGYELPITASYPEHVTLHRSPYCSPCWLREPCPFDRRCLKDISVDEVEQAARRILATFRENRQLEASTGDGRRRWIR